MVVAPTIIEKRWTSDSSQYLAIEYDDTYLIYFKPSGETHFLNFLSFGVVDSVSKASLSGAELLERLRVEFSLTPDELPETLVVSTIEELDRAGLITVMETIE